MPAPIRPNVFADGETVDALRVNQDLNELYNWAAETSLDSVDAGAETFYSHQTGEVDLVSSSYVAWPYAAVDTIVPTWATEALVIANLNVKYVTSSSKNYVRIKLGAVEGTAWQWGLPVIFGEPSTAEKIYGYDSIAHTEKFYVGDKQGTTLGLGLEGRRFDGTGAVRSSMVSFVVIFTA